MNVNNHLNAPGDILKSFFFFFFKENFIRVLVFNVNT